MNFIFAITVAFIMCLSMLGLTLKDTGFYEDRQLLTKKVPIYNINRKRYLREFMSSIESDKLIMDSDDEIQEYLHLKSSSSMSAEDINEYNNFIYYREYLERQAEEKKIGRMPTELFNPIR